MVVRGGCLNGDAEVGEDALGDGCHEFMAEGADALQVFCVGEEADFYQDCRGDGLAEYGKGGEVEVFIRAGLDFVGSAGHDGTQAGGDFLCEFFAAGTVCIRAVLPVGAVVADVRTASRGGVGGVAMEADYEGVVAGVDGLDGCGEVCGVGGMGKVYDVYGAAVVF